MKGKRNSPHGRDARDCRSWSRAARYVAVSLRGDRVLRSISQQTGGWAYAAGIMAGSLRTRGAGMSESITPRHILGLLRRQQYRCAYTGEVLSPATVSADHFVPLSRGGSHSLSNVRLVTKQANRAKGTMTFEEFVALCISVVRASEANAGNDSRPGVIGNTELFDNTPDQSGGGSQRAA